MYVNFKKIFFVLALLAIGIGIGIAGAKLVQRYQTPKQTVSVVGTGEVDAATDQATISIQITDKKDAQTLKDALINLGIPESRITQSSDGEPIYQADTASDTMMYPRPNPTTNTSFTVILDSLKNIKKVFATINANPHTQITNTYYSLNNSKSWESKAKEAALNDARSQVESVAKINHLTVGKLVSLTDVNSSPPIIEPMMLKGAAPAQNGVLQQDQTATTKQTAQENSYYSEQTVKITSSYTAQYELY